MDAPIVVSLPDGSEAEFPAGTPIPTIQSAIQKRFPPKQSATTAQEPSAMSSVEGAYPDNISGKWDTTPVGGSSDKQSGLFAATGAAASNIVPSAVGLVKGAAKAFTPSGMEAISKVARGGLGISPEEQPSWDAFKTGLVNRYGGYENLKKTFAEDPVGLLTDYYATKSLAGAATRAAATKLGIPDAIASMADTQAKSLFQSALKPAGGMRGKLKTSEIDKRVTAGLREGVNEGIYPVGAENIAAIDDLIEQSNMVTRGAIAAKGMSGNQIPTAPLRKAYESVVANAKKGPIYETLKGPQFDKLATDISKWPETISAEQMLRWRMDFNDSLRSAFERAKRIGSVDEPLAVDSLRAVRLKANEAIHELVPELKQLGIRESELIGLKQSMEARTGNVGNWDLISLTGALVGLSGATPVTQMGKLIAWQTLSMPNIKAAIAFQLAKRGKLVSASPSTLELLDMTRESALKMQPVLKALNAAPRQMGSGIPDQSGINVTTGPPLYYPQKALPPPARSMESGIPDRTGIIRGGQEIVHGENVPGVYDQAWMKQAEKYGQEGQTTIIPKTSLLQDRAPMPVEYPYNIPPKMLADPGRFRNPPPEPYGGAVSSRGNAIVDSVRLGQMHPILGARELSNMANEAQMVGNFYAAEKYRDLSIKLLKKSQ